MEKEGVFKASNQERERIVQQLLMTLPEAKATVEVLSAIRREKIAQEKVGLYLLV
jgi:hypothetical protein